MKTAHNLKLAVPTSHEFLRKHGYELVQLLGEGSFATVYLAKFTRPNSSDEASTIACKVVNLRRAPRDVLTKFFPRELDIILKVQHQNIIRIHSILRHEQLYYIFMAYSEKGDLYKYISENGAIEENQAKIWFKQLVCAVKYLHDINIAHRDLKCENILITAHYNVRITDFGFARPTIDSGGKQVFSETYCGSLSYAAPEIINATPYDAKMSDIWALGVVLYVMLNKSMPFDETNLRKMHMQQMERKWKFRGKVEYVLSPEVKDLVEELLEPDPVKRIYIDKIMSSEWIKPRPEVVSIFKSPEVLVLEGTEVEDTHVEAPLTKSKSFKSTEVEKHATSAKSAKATSHDADREIPRSGKAGTSRKSPKQSMLNQQSPKPKLMKIPFEKRKPTKN